MSVKVRKSAQHAWEVSTLIQSAEFVRNVLKIVRHASTIPSARSAPQASTYTTIKASALSAPFTGMEHMERVLMDQGLASPAEISARLALHRLAIPASQGLKE